MEIVKRFSSFSLKDSGSTKYYVHGAPGKLPDGTGKAREKLLTTGQSHWCVSKDIKGPQWEQTPAEKFEDSAAKVTSDAVQKNRPSVSFCSKWQYTK